MALWGSERQAGLAIRLVWGVQSAQALLSPFADMLHISLTTFRRAYLVFVT